MRNVALAINWKVINWNWTPNITKMTTEINALNLNRDI